MAFVREIRRNGVLYRVQQLIKSKKGDINDIPMKNFALRACYGISNRIASNQKIYQLIESIKFHINDITICGPIFLVPLSPSYPISPVLEIHLNPVMLVFIGKLSLSSFRCVPMCQGFRHFSGFFCIILYWPN